MRLVVSCRQAHGTPRRWQTWRLLFSNTLPVKRKVLSAVSCLTGDLKGISSNPYACHNDGSGQCWHLPKNAGVFYQWVKTCWVAYLTGTTPHICNTQSGIPSGRTKIDALGKSTPQKYNAVKPWLPGRRSSDANSTPLHLLVVKNSSTLFTPRHNKMEFLAVRETGTSAILMHWLDDCQWISTIHAEHKWKLIIIS